METFKLPDLGEGLPDAEIVEWMVEVGDVVSVDQPIVSMETAKAVVEVPSPFAGTIAVLHGAAGDVIDTGAALVSFDDGVGIQGADGGHVEDDGEELPLDVCFVLREGKDVTLVSWGAMIKETLEAADQLTEMGISAEVIDVATISPLDTDTIIESVAKTGRCVIIHEAARNCGVGAEIAAQLADKGIYHLHAPVKRVTGYDTIMPLYRNEKKYMPSTQRILRAVNEVLED